MTTDHVPACALCTSDGGTLVFRNDHLRVIQADEPGFPAFYRVVWNAHVAEFSDLTATERNTCMQAVMAVEQALRSVLRPTKINLAALGNMVPHLHWHVVARFERDSHFPAPVWSAAQRPLDELFVGQVDVQRQHVHEAIAKNIAAQAL